jgi:two-component system, OmpR family, alkaline phosphatase synthesis response regulator PhoP
MNESILLVEDDAAVRTTLTDRLRGEGYVVDTAVDGHEASEKAANLPFDLVILDLMLPSRNGLDVCRDIRQAGMATPILILTARTQTIDKVVGLKLGADDYVTKPFESAELIARIEVLLRRMPVQAGHGIVKFGSTLVDLKRREVTRDGKPVALTAREFQLLQYFIARAGVSLPRKELLRSVWGYDDEALTRTVDTHIVSLRQKLEENPKRPQLIVTVSGVGYKFTGSAHS